MSLLCVACKLQPLVVAFIEKVIDGALSHESASLKALFDIDAVEQLIKVAKDCYQFIYEFLHCVYECDGLDPSKPFPANMVSVLGKLVKSEEACVDAKVALAIPNNANLSSFHANVRRIHIVTV